MHVTSHARLLRLRHCSRCRSLSGTLIYAGQSQEGIRGLGVRWRGVSVEAVSVRGTLWVVKVKDKVLGQGYGPSPLGVWLG